MPRVIEAQELIEACAKIDAYSKELIGTTVSQSNEYAYRNGSAQAAACISNNMKELFSRDDIIEFMNILTDVLYDLKVDTNEYPQLMHEAIGIAMRELRNKQGSVYSPFSGNA